LSTAAPTIYIWVRPSVEWRDEAAFYAQLPDDLEDKVRLWNQTFKLSYHLFRYKVREIARLNLARVDGAVCASWEAIPIGALVVPVDDDDWFAPHLASALFAAQVPGISGYHWRSHFLEVPIHLRHQVDQVRRWLQPGKPSYWLCATNNYAVIKRADNQAHLQDHTKASAWFASEGRNAVKDIAQSLSLMNRTIGSHTAMEYKRPPLARGKLLLARYRYQRRYRQVAGPELAWAEPYQQMMALLMDEL
jgi:hypothetical protein